MPLLLHVFFFFFRVRQRWARVAENSEAKIKKSLSGFLSLTRVLFTSPGTPVHHRKRRHVGTVLTNMSTVIGSFSG